MPKISRPEMAKDGIPAFRIHTISFDGIDSPDVLISFKSDPILIYNGKIINNGTTNSNISKENSKKAK